ncbi:hypothetical protein TNCV_3740661 [Trichonephila clavipes]|nr:hypothetical protein TNCV_3740661 [Trichonephila clavipes]
MRTIGDGLHNPEARTTEEDDNQTGASLSNLPHLPNPSGQGIGSWQAYHEFSTPVPLKTRRVEKRCTLNPSRAEMSSRWCGGVVRRGSASSGVAHVI